ncbi:MAG TPA: cell division FtsA domain-containing protein [Bacillota bacterium]|nr:cell division FtsA domain-containing protein [Bacillota bacterium]
MTEENLIFALDIGTRSIIGIVGTMEEEKLRVIAIEKEAHVERSMVDGQIEDIEKVAKTAGIVKTRLEEKLHCNLREVCVAAAGRALRTQRASYQMEFPYPQRIDDEIISRLEAGAIGEAEAIFSDELSDENSRQFYLVGHTAVQYYMDGYPTSHLLDHHARNIQADVIATFLPREVVESLYSVMHKIGLEVASLTLEPIAAMNVVIPKNLRLLNLALVDIGAGTSDIAVSRDGGVVGYTIVTVAGDEITEALMKKYLLDFNTADSLKIQLGSQESACFTDILGVEQTITRDDMAACIEESVDNLCREISEHICEVNGAPVSAVFLAGGGSKLASLQPGIAKYMEMDEKRVAVAGNNFQAYAVSDAYELNDPEYATPLGIAISAGLNLLTDSFHVTLNGGRAGLFRNNTMTILDILMMNGFSYRDIIPQSGRKLIIQVNGKQALYHGTPGEPATLLKNGREARISDLVYTGDDIEFSPAVNGHPARCFLKDLLEGGSVRSATVNGKPASPDTLLRTGDVVVTEDRLVEQPAIAAEESDVHEPEIDGASASRAFTELNLNDKPLVLPPKSDGSPYYLMEMLELSGIDLSHPTGEIVLRVNGVDGLFLDELKSGDHVEIYFRG